MSFLACTEQYQVCDSFQCNEPSGLYTILSAKKYLSLNPKQAATFDLAWKAIWSSNLEFQKYFFGSSVLLANEKLYGIGMMSAALINRQWELEVANMHNISLAGLQSRVVEFVAPGDFEIHPNVTSSQFLVPASGAEQLTLCQSVKIRSNIHTSFRVYAIVVVLLVGGVIHLISLSLSSIDSKLIISSDPHNYRHVEWAQTHIFQLQRRIFKLAGIRTWKGRESGVPVTVQYGLLFPGCVEAAPIPPNRFENSLWTELKAGPRRRRSI
jgi:hypothetical protein